MQFFKLAFAFFLVVTFLPQAVTAAQKPSKIVCMASLVGADASDDELRIALALEEMFYCRAAQIPGIATLQTTAREYNPPGGLPFSFEFSDGGEREFDVDWRVPHFRERGKAAAFAKTHDIDLLFFGDLSYDEGKYTIVIDSTKEEGKQLKVSASNEELCAAWLKLICNLSDHTGIQLSEKQKISVTNPSQKPRFIDLLALGAMIQDNDVSDDDANFDSVLGVGQDKLPDIDQLEERYLEFWGECKLPEFFHKFSYYGIPEGVENVGGGFMTAIGLHPSFSKSFVYLPFNDPPILPYHVMKENGFGTAAFLKNLKTFELSPEFMNRIEKILEKQSRAVVPEEILWYLEQALSKDDDDYWSRATVLLYLALKNDEASYKRHATILRGMYPRRAAQMFERLIKPSLGHNKSLRKDQRKWEDAYFNRPPKKVDPNSPEERAKAARARAETAAAIELFETRKAKPRAGEMCKLPIGDGVMMTFCWVPAGKFRMGSLEGEVGRSADEGPAKEIAIKEGFWMGKYEVTQEEWEAVMGSNPSDYYGSKRLPVEEVSWNDICGDGVRNGGFLGKLMKRVPKNWRYALPGEAQWEYACRAGTTTAYVAGDYVEFGQGGIQSMHRVEALNKSGWYTQNAGGKTHEVGMKPANAFGLHDMHGNVKEWCQDLYLESYEKGEKFDPETYINGPTPTRVIRGGCWNSDANACRSAARDSNYPYNHNHYLGFRLTLQPASK